MPHAHVPCGYVHGPGFSPLAHAGAGPPPNVAGQATFFGGDFLEATRVGALALVLSLSLGSGDATATKVSRSGGGALTLAGGGAVTIADAGAVALPVAAAPASEVATRGASMDAAAPPHATNEKMTTGASFMRESVSIGERTANRSSASRVSR